MSGAPRGRGAPAGAAGPQHTTATKATDHMMGLRERLVLAGSLPEAGAPGAAGPNASAGELLALGRSISCRMTEVPTAAIGYLYFPSQAEAHEAALHARDLGWVTEVRQPEGLVRDWIVAARQTIDLARDGADRVHRELGSIAEALGGEFEGWERVDA